MESSSPPPFDLISLDETAHFDAFTATIGFFDGLHRGHQHLLEQLRQVAQSRQEGTLVVSFQQHPRQVLGHAAAPQLLTPREGLPTLFREAGIQRCALLHFDTAMAALSAREFMELVLHQRLNVRTLMVGYDHHFGRPRAGEGFEQYQTYGRELGIEVLRADAFRLDDSEQNIAPKVASSSIRLLLQQGNVLQAAQLLGRPYRLEGQVVMGRQNGRKIGYPTANLQVDCPQQLVPQQGVYATRAWIGGKAHAAMTNIGHRPTFDNGQDVSIETHIFDLQADLYDQPLALDFVSRLRDEQRFEGLEALVAQLALDAQVARHILQG